MLLSSPLWRSPGTLCAGTLPVRASAFSFDSEDSALAAAGSPDHGPYCVSLAGRWKFRYLENPAGLTDADLDADCRAWDEITVPGAWTVQGYDRPHYTNVRMPYAEQPPRVPEKNPAGIYRTRFTVPEAWRGRRIVLHFDGVESCFAVRVNGHDAGFAKNSRGAHEFDVTDFCHSGANDLAVLAVKWSDANFIEDQDMWWHGGIVRDVLLLSRPADHIADLFACATLTEDLRHGQLTVQGKVRFASREEFAKGWKLRIDLFDPAGRPVRGFPHDMEITGGSVDAGFAPVGGPEYSASYAVARVKAWSAEHPHLYKVSAALTDPEGRAVEYTAYRVGFRRVEVKNRKLLINGEAVRIHGVNRHESHPRTGRTVTREDVERDLKLMKRFNINAIRTSHYPDCPEFYDLCDEYGFYVWDEANLEHHAFYQSLCRNQAWAPAFAERAAHLVERDKNHPSVVVWSLGNESGFGANQAAMAGYIRFRDPSRPLHYEGAIHRAGHWPEPNHNRFLTDIVCPMYPAVDKLYEWSRTGADDPRPYIMCEYSHAMGNSNGELKDYFEAFDRCEGVQGGFIWEWCDHALYKRDASGREFLAYGGDFGDTPNDGNFVCDGLVGAERDPHPGLEEYKYLARPVRITAVDPAHGVFELENRQYFSDLSAFRLRWEIAVDGRTVRRGTPPMPKVPARFGAKARIAVAYPDWGRFRGKTVHLTFFTVLKRAARWADAGFEVAHEQFALPVKLTPKRAARPAVPAEVVETNDLIELKAGPLTAAVRRDTGAVLWRRGEGEDLTGPEPWFFRAPVDNDGFRLPQISNRTRPLAAWLANGYDRMTAAVTEVAPTRDGVRVVRTITAPGVAGAAVRHEMLLAARRDGSIAVANRFTVPEVFEDLPRVGLVWELPLGFDTVEYLGLGPHENYRDRDAAALFARYTLPVEELPGNYLMPQSAGNRTGVREVVLRGEAGSWRVTAEGKAFEFSIQPYSDAELFAAHHRHELGKQRAWYLHLDAVQRGVGTQSCGPALQERYRVAPGEYELDFVVM